MLEKSKLQEIEKNIESKKAELKEAKADRKKADKPETMVELDKKISELENIIARIENAKKALTYLPPAKSTVDKYLECLDKYYKAKKEKVKAITDTYNQKLAEISECEQLVQNATNEYAFDDAVEHAKKRDNLKEQLKYIEQMKIKTETAHVFQSDELTNEWVNICESVREEFNLSLERIELLASEYKLAVRQFEEFYKTLLNTRKKIGQIAAKDNTEFYPPTVLTDFSMCPYEYFDKYNIQKADANRMSYLLARGIVGSVQSV